MRVSRSGGWTSVIRPHSNRLRSRSSSVVELLGRPVGGEHDLLVGVVEGVEGVEELLLRLDLALEELDVVDEQHVDVAVAALEAVLPVVADRVDELVGELLAGHVAHLGAGVEAADVVSDGVQQVGLAESGVAVDQQRVVGLARGLGDGDGGGVREPVRRADDEGLEGVLRVEPGLQRGRGAARARTARRRAGCSGSGRSTADLGVALSTYHFLDLPTWGSTRSGVGRSSGASVSSSSSRLTVTAIRISRPKASLSASSSWPRSRPSSWVAGEVVGHRDDRGASRAWSPAGWRAATPAGWAAGRRRVAATRWPARAVSFSTGSTLCRLARAPGPDWARASSSWTCLQRWLHNFLHRLCNCVVRDEADAGPSRTRGRRDLTSFPQVRAAYQRDPDRWPVTIAIGATTRTAGNLGRPEGNKRWTGSASVHPQAGTAWV